MTDSYDVDIQGDYEGIDFETITKEELDTAAVNTVNAWMENMLAEDYKATSDTVNSITWEAPEALVRRIGSDRIAALIGELGRAPGAGHPPPDAIADWVHEKPGLPSRGETVEWEFDGEVQEVSFDQVVYLIGRSINVNGLPAHKFGDRALEQEGPKFEESLIRRLQEAAEEQST